MTGEEEAWVQSITDRYINRSEKKKNEACPEREGTGSSVPKACPHYA